MKSQFKENLLVLRKRKGFTQKQLGKRLGIGDVQLSKYERGLSSPGMSMLVKMSDVLNCTLDELVGK